LFICDGADCGSAAVNARTRLSEGEDWGTRRSLTNARLEDRFQFERVGYFCLDHDSTPGNLVFNRTLPLEDSWAKIEKKAGV
jgi:hypothetical protein